LIISTVALYNIPTPLWCGHWYGTANPIIMHTPRQSISGSVISPFLVDNTISETLELGENFLLPHGVEPLIIEMGQGLLISVNDEFGQLQV
jgi:hypothetical protein